MELQPGTCPVEVITPLVFTVGSTPVRVPDVRHAPLKNHHGLVVVVPVKSSWTEDCACTVNGAARTAIATSALKKVLRLITNHLG